MLVQISTTADSIEYPTVTIVSSSAAAILRLDKLSSGPAPTVCSGTCFVEAFRGFTRDLESGLTGSGLTRVREALLGLHPTHKKVRRETEDSCLLGGLHILIYWHACSWHSRHAALFELPRSSSAKCYSFHCFLLLVVLVSHHKIYFKELSQEGGTISDGDQT